LQTNVKHIKTNTRNILCCYFNALMATLKPHNNGPLYSKFSNTAIGTLAVDERAVTFCKGKGKGLDTCYSATYMSQTRDQQRFTISEVAADWHEPMVPQRIMWPSIARANGQLDPRCS